jgi:hypothetical protein
MIKSLVITQAFDGLVDSLYVSEIDFYGLLEEPRNLLYEDSKNREQYGIER